jgi:IclR family transcriptional regulator, acetate operon repressor
MARRTLTPSRGPSGRGATKAIRTQDMSVEGAADGPLMRALGVIEYVATSRRPLTVAEIAEGLSLPRTTAHRLVGGLEGRGLLQHPLGSKRFEVGDRMLDLGAKVIGAGLRGGGRHAILQDLARRIGEQCEIGIVRHGRVVYVDNIRPLAATGLQFDPGVEAPLHCSSTGKLFLSRRSTGPRERLVRSLVLERFTDKTIVDSDALLEELRVTRRRGWATSNEEFVAGVVGCAVPVLSPDGTLVAGLGVSVPAARVSLAELRRFVPAMKEAAERLSRSIPASGPDGAGDETDAGARRRPSPSKPDEGEDDARPL